MSLAVDLKQEGMKFVEQSDLLVCTEPTEAPRRELRRLNRHRI